MEFNFKSYDNSKQSISYCEVDKCKAVIKLKKCLQEIKEIVQFGFRPYKVCGEHNNCCDVLNEIWNKISECEVEDT